MLKRIPWSTLVPLAFLMLATSFHAIEPTIIEQIRYRVFDEYQRLNPRPYSGDVPVRILDIDDESLARVGQWPWPRDIIAEIVARLSELGAAAIVFDMVFSQPDRLSPESLSQLLPDRAEFNAVRESLSSIPNNDALFARTISEAYVVAAFALVEGKTGRAPLPKAGIAENGDAAWPYVPSFLGSVTTLEEIEAAAAGNGAINALPDSDGIYRRLPMFVGLDKQIYPSLASEALRVAQDASTYVIRAVGASGEEGFGESGLVGFKVGNVTVPTDANGQIHIRFAGDVPERYVPAWKLLAGEAPVDKLAGHIVLIGTSAAALKDLRPTPFDPAAAGVSLHAEVLETVLTGQYLLRPDFAHGLEVVVTFALGVLLIWLLPRWGALWCAILGAGAIFAVVAGSWIAFTEYNWLFDPLYAAVVVLLVYLTKSLLVFLASEAERERIRGAFGMYLSPTLVEQLASHPDRLKLGGEMRELSLLFCDVRGFTSISELYDPQGLTQLINRFLTPMTQIILDRNGTIDKYMGDCIMAFWNAPLDERQHAGEACRSALAMQRRLRDLNAELERDAKAEGREFRPLAVGVGLNTGVVCVGNMGSEQRFDYTVLGDDVNLASRIEGLTKMYEVEIACSEATLAAAEREGDRFAALELDLIRVKGKSRPVRLFAVLGEQEVLDADWFKTLKPVHDQMIAAYRSRDWDGAQALLDQAREIAGDRLAEVYGLYDVRLLAFSADPPGEDWDGAVDALTK